METIFFTVLLTAAGCATPPPTLRMKGNIPPNDQTAVAARLAEKKYSRIMVIPPSGTERGKFDTQMSMFEREFLKHGITVISSAITGRVVMEESAEKGEKKTESAQELSDAERALIMAKKTGADALLQVGEYDWSTDGVPSRFFVLDPNSTAYREVAESEYTTWSGGKYQFGAQKLTFIGKLIDVLTGEIMASFSIECPANWSLPSDYSTEISNNFRTNENYPYLITDANTGKEVFGSWYPSAVKNAENKIIQLVVDKITGK